MTDSPTALDLPQVDPLPAATQRYFDICEEKLGMVPNVLRAYAFDIAKLDVFAALYNDLMLGDSDLTRLERELIAVAVSAENRCWYCLVAHGAAVRQMSGDPAFGERMVLNWRTADLDARMTAILKFAVKLTRDPAAMGTADRTALRAAGLDDRAIWDVASVAAFFNMTNRVASATGMEPNAEYHASGR